MLPTGLEKLVLSGQAKVGSAVLGLGALSSFSLPDKKNAIVYQIGIHPFVDLTRAEWISTDRYVPLASVGHVYEFGDDYNRFQISDRSSFSNERGVDYAAIAGAGQVMIPQHGQTIVPVYWRFNSRNVVLRIFKIPSATDGAQVNIDTPPQIEQSYAGGYGTIPVSGSMEGFGGPGNTNYWQPDTRNPASLPLQTRVLNARGLPTAAGGTPAIHPYRSGNVTGVNKLSYGVYSMPLVNVSYVYFDETLTFQNL
jgi:hypothetical protein